MSHVIAFAIGGLLGVLAIRRIPRERLDRAMLAAWAIGSRDQRLPEVSELDEIARLS